MTDRSAPPRPGARRPFRFPPFEIRTLANGLRIFHAPHARGPLVYQLLVTPGGGQADPPQRAGLGSLTAALMGEGTADHSALEIAERVEKLGGYLSTQADWDSMSAAVGVLAKHLQPGIELLAEVATRATFPEQELERLRSQHLAELQRRLAQPSALASDALAEVVYGQTAYGTPILGTPESLAAIERRDSVGLARHQVTPRGSALIVVGDCAADDSLAMIEEAFGDWHGDPAPAAAAIDPARLEGIRLSIVDRPQAPQTELWLGHVGIPRTHPERAGIVVLNSLLGGKFTSRINLNLRERLGITYGASTSFAQRRGPGPFVVAAAVDTGAAGQALREILFEMQRLHDEPVPEDELEDTKSYLLGVFPYTLQRIEDVAARLADLAVYDLPEDYFETYIAELAAVTSSDLQRLARQHLAPAHIAVVAVGPRSELEDQLAPSGPLEIRAAPTSPAVPFADS